jgi:hypothetical protein
MGWIWERYGMELRIGLASIFARAPALSDKISKREDLDEE